MHSICVIFLIDGLFTHASDGCLWPVRHGLLHRVSRLFLRRSVKLKFVKLFFFLCSTEMKGQSEESGQDKYLEHIDCLL